MLWINVLGDTGNLNSSCVDVSLLILECLPAEGSFAVLIIKRLKIYQMNGLIQNLIDLNSGIIIHQYN